LVCCATFDPLSVEPGKPSKEQATNRLIWKEKKSMAAQFFSKAITCDNIEEIG